ncbi:MAG TPA: sigma-54 dependent transcriptional regulator, partial [Myxococcales bacterium]|nr:sigma-54 dependent transcriptional regulator [Myxococcales bacterium]
DGLTVLREVRRMLPGTPVLVMTAFGSVATSVEAMRLGAVTMLEKPVPVAQLEREVRDAIAAAREVEGGLEAAGGAGLIGDSPAIRAVFDTLVRVAPSNSTVLIQGESGTGKELIAQAVHRLSRRALGPLVAVNCAAIPEQLLESELFGHTKGAFTGALQSRPGRFRMADGGTIFLDEIGEMPLALQGKLLRVLQERAVEPVGGSKPEPVDFRLIAATNKDLEGQVAQGAFRGDLFYRLHVVPLVVPPLRERRGDVPLLAAHFLARHNAEKERPLLFSTAAVEALERYAWPGNVRELENLVERLAVLRGEGEIGLADLPGPIRNALSAGAVANGNGSHIPTALPPEGVDLYKVLADLEDRLIREALQRSGGNKNQAAKILGLNRTTLVEKLRKKGALKGSGGVQG